MRTTQRGLAAAAVLAVLAALPAGAPAQAPTVTTLGGSPLTVMVGSQGQLQAKRAGDAANIFFRPDSQLGDAGFFLAFPGPGQPAALSGRVFGFDGSAGPSLVADNEYLPGTQSPSVGDGSPANPFTQITTYTAVADLDAVPTTDPQPVASITQTTTYVSGAQTFTVRWDVKNATGAPLRFKALAAADFYFEGSDVGTGIFTQGPPRFVGGTNADTGRSGGFVEIPAPAPLLPWSHYQALAYADPSGNDVWTRLQHAGDAATPSYDDSVVGEPVDNAGAVEWDQYLDAARTLPSGGTASFSLMVRTALPAALQFDQTNAGAPQGVPITFHVTAKDTADTPFAGKALISTITGANPGTQSAVLGPDGGAAVTDPGVNAGADTVVSFVDLNGNGARDAAEPQGSALATFVDKTPPSCTVKVTGDRPVGSGGQGKPLMITVSCGESATVATASTLTITPAAKKAKQARAAAAATKKKPKHKKKKKPAKPKPVVVKLPATSTIVAPGQALPITIAIPASVTKKYPGATALATVTVTARDAAGNVATTKATKKVTIAKPKAKKKAKAKPKKKAKH